MTDQELKAISKRMRELTRKRNKKLREKPWKHPEPVKTWEAFGLRCMLLQGPHGGLNGYVIVPPEHPWYAVHYSECTKNCDTESCYEHTPEGLIEVHGGITFSGLGEDGWIFGFDTAHAGDYTFYASGAAGVGDHRWTEQEVTEETEKMAEQLAAYMLPL